MNCPKCNNKLKRVNVSIEDAETKAVSYQCSNCDYVTFDPKSSIQVIREIKNSLSSSIHFKKCGFLSSFVT